MAMGTCTRTPHFSAQWPCLRLERSSVPCHRGLSAAVCSTTEPSEGIQTPLACACGELTCGVGLPPLVVVHVEGPQLASYAA